MKTDGIYGKFEYNDKGYPFFIKGQVLTIVQEPREHNRDFENMSKIKRLRGITNDNQIIIMCNCKVMGGLIFSNIAITFQWFALFSVDIESFQRVEFASTALNGFFSPQRAREIEFHDNTLRVQSLQIKKAEDTVETFECVINEEQITCKLSVKTIIPFRPDTSALGTANTVFSMDFQHPKQPEELGEYYLYLLDFLVFTNFQKDIPIDSIELFYAPSAGTYSKCGAVKMFQIDCSNYQPEFRSSITFDDIGKEYVANLFTMVAEQRLTSNYNNYYIPESSSEKHKVNAIKWLSAALSFEGEFNKSFPHHKCETDEQFKNAKEMLRNVLDEEVKKSGFGIYNEKNIYHKRFRSLIERSDTTIREKYQYTIERYKESIIDIRKKHTGERGVPEDADIVTAYESYRNSTAHGDIKMLSAVDVLNFALLQSLIYALLLDRAGLNTEKIRKIVAKLF